MVFTQYRPDSWQACYLCPKTVKRTLRQYDEVVRSCREVFLAKTKDYGTAWRILRASSLTDQLFIKARRIRTLEEGAEQKVPDDIGQEYIGLVNYSVMALIQLALPEGAPLELPLEEVKDRYDACLDEIRALMQAKNNDYGEAWRGMRISSLTDMILMKLLRIKQIEDNAGRTIASEGLEANYQDIVNYAIFALIRLSELSEEESR